MTNQEIDKYGYLKKGQLSLFQMDYISQHPEKTNLEVAVDLGLTIQQVNLARKRGYDYKVKVQFT